MSWGLFALLVLAAFALITVPGALVLWLLRIRDARLLLLGPAVGVGVLGGLTLLAAPFGGWGWGYIVGLLVFLAAAVVLQRQRSAADFVVTPRLPRRTVIYALLGIGVFLVVYIPAILTYWTGPGSPQSFGDVAFHTQGTLLVWFSGDVNPMGALGAIYDPVNPPGIYYPTLWHALASLFVSVGGAGVATNALIVAVGLLAWPLTVSALGVAVSRRYSSAAFWAPFFASFLALFPAELLFRNSMNPFGLSVLSVPAALAIILWALGSKPQTKARIWRWVIALVLVTVGAIAAQPTTALLIALVLFAFGAVMFVRAMYRWAQSGHATLALLVTVAGFGAVALGARVAANLSMVQQLGMFYRPSLPTSVALMQFFRGGGFDFQRLWTSYMPWTAIIFVALIGVLLLIRQRRGQIAATLTALFLFVYVAAAGPDGWLRDLTGFWYKDYTRLAVFVFMMIVVFAAHGTAWFVNAVASLVDRYRIPVAAVTSFGIIVFFQFASTLEVRGELVTVDSRVRFGYSQDQAVQNLIDEDRAELLGVIGDEFDDGTYILGLPMVGAQFVSGSSHTLAFMPLNHPVTTEQVLLASSLDQIYTNPEVCQIITDANIEGFVTLRPDQLDDPDLEGLELYQGMVEVDKGDGFELVHAAGPLELWRITACQ